jgi:alginate O-acetyltransferase complex protein AlgI
MSYPIDVYRSDCGAQRSFVRFGLFVSLFPQLIAGPIVRYKDIAVQLDKRRETHLDFALGAERFTVGLAKKVLLANNIGALWDFYKAQQSPSALGAWIGIIAFSFQIYFDFSGYSDMAIGLGRMFGFKFLENFNYPYVSSSVTEFWRRWHISLSTWFRDYVYIPLGGNRKGLARQLFNIAVVWALTGFWHGANWNFLAWGFYYAVLLIAEKTFLLNALNRLPKAVRHVYTLLAVVFGWALFALDDKAALSLGGYLAAMFGANGGAAGVDLYQLREYAVTFIVLIFASLPLWRGIAVLSAVKLSNAVADTRRLERTFSIVKPLLVLLALIICTAYLVNSGYNPFLYFRF